MAGKIGKPYYDNPIRKAELNQGHIFQILDQATNEINRLN